ncbi:sigma-70 family RNA polymerase sigma factor [Streptomyces sp. NPDC047046]|uniref:sigma-70 family RNA polymerase sigma factor n=1 Tax=Streptomyces sp. NPDC047046 TaxID=3155378 RepID=UPI0033C6DC04
MSKKDRSEPRTGAGDAGAGTEGVEGPARETVPGQGRGAHEGGSGTEQDGARAHVPRQGGHPAAGDGDLLHRARGGDEAAYAELYRRHADGVRRYARTCCRDRDTAEDLTAEVFARTLAALRHGAGPEYAMRAYLLTTVRRVAADWAQTARREQLVDDFAVFAAQAARAPSADGDAVDLGADVLAMHEAEQSMAVRAFRSLPERWQAVLWHTEVENESPSEIAVLFGLDANGTRVLASRAREGLKQAYLQAHVSAARTASEDCAAYADRLGAYARGGLRSRAERGLRKHLKECAECRLAASQVKEVAGGIPGLVPLAVIGWFGAAGYGKALGLIGGAAGAGAAGSAAAVGGGGAASEGVGAPVKAGIAAGVVATAAVALALVLAAQEQDKRHPEQPPLPEAKPPAVQPLVPSPTPPHRPAPVTAEPSAPPRVSVPPRAPEPARPTPRAPRPAPASPTPPPSKPSPTPAPPTSVPPPPPVEPVEYRWSTLPYGLTGDGTGPEMRLSGSPVWQRPGGMTIGGRRYGHGVSVRIPSGTTIDLNRDCTDYEAYAGLDDMTLGLGAARFAVWADGVRLWRSGVLRGGEPAVTVRVGIAGRRTVRLVVEAVDPASVPAPGGSIAGSHVGDGDGDGPGIGDGLRIGDARGTLGRLGRLGVADWAGSRFTCE